MFVVALLALARGALAGPVVDCARTWSQAGLLDVVQSAEGSMSRLDRDAFLAARDTLLGRLVCVDEPLSGPAIGAVHRVVATAADIEEQDTRVAPALAGLLAADPGYQLPVALYPDGHPVRGLLSHAAILARDSAARPLATPDSGWFEVDGLSASAAPVARASVIQRVDAQGHVSETRYVWPADDLGDWAGADAPSVATARRPSHPARAPLLLGTLAAGAATGVLYGLARADYDAFHDSGDRTESELLALQETTNTLTIGWAATGIATLGLGVGLAFSW